MNIGKLRALHNLASIEQRYATHKGERALYIYIVTITGALIKAYAATKGIHT